MELFIIFTTPVVGLFLHIMIMNEMQRRKMNPFSNEVNATLFLSFVFLVLLPTLLVSILIW